MSLGINRDKVGRGEMNVYQACALSLGLNLLVGAGMIPWNRFGSKKKTGVGD